MALTTEQRQRLEAIAGSPRKKTLEGIFSTDPTPKVDIQAETERQQGVSGLAGVGVGAAKGVASTLTGASSLGERGIKAVGRFFTPKKFEEKLGFAKEDTTAAERLVPEEFRTAQGTAEKIGFFGEQIVEFLIPGAAPLKAGKAAKVALAARDVGKLGQRAGRLTAISASEAGLGAGQAAIQTGEFGEEAKKTGIAGAILPGAFKVVGKLAKPVFSSIGRGAAGLSGKLTGTQSDVIIEAFKNKNVIKATRLAGKDIEVAQEGLFSDIKSGLGKLMETRAKNYQARLAPIKLVKTELDDIVRGTRETAQEQLDKFDIKINQPSLTDTTGKLNILNFDGSTILKGQDVLEKAFNDVMRWTDNTPAGIDKLKRRLYSFGSQLTTRETSEAKKIVDSLAGSVRKGLIDNVKGYKEMVGDYEKMSSLIDEITVAFSLGGKNKETAIKRIMSALRENNQTRKDLLEVIGGRTGQDIVADVAGVQLAPASSRGLAGIIGVGPAGLIGLVNPSLLPEILTFLALTSPRLTAELVNVMGRVTDKMVQTNKFSPEIQRIIRELIIKAKEE